MYVYLNGEVKPKNQVNLSIDDRGFTFGEGIYEVVRVYGGKKFLLPEHMERLKRSAAEMDIGLPEYFNYSHLEEAIDSLVEKSGLKESYLYLQVTRGVQFRSHVYQENMEPTIVMYLIGAKDWSLERQGVPAAIEEDIRWQRCDVKSTMLMPGTLLKSRAARKGYFEVILERDGIITEGTSNNIFCCKDNVLITPPLSNFILPGITREFVLRLTKQLGISVDERPIHVSELSEMQEAFITATGTEVIPLNKIGEYNYDAPGKLTTKIISAFDAAIKELRET